MHNSRGGIWVSSTQTRGAGGQLPRGAFQPELGIRRPPSRQGAQGPWGSSGAKGGALPMRQSFPWPHWWHQDGHIATESGSIGAMVPAKSGGLGRARGCCISGAWHLAMFSEGKPGSVFRGCDGGPHCSLGPLPMEWGQTGPQTRRSKTRGWRREQWGLTPWKRSGQRWPRGPWTACSMPPLQSGSPLVPSPRCPHASAPSARPPQSQVAESQRRGDLGKRQPAPR